MLVLTGFWWSVVRKLTNNNLFLVIVRIKCIFMDLLEKILIGKKYVRALFVPTWEVKKGPFEHLRKLRD